MCGQLQVTQVQTTYQCGGFEELSHTHYCNTRSVQTQQRALLHIIMRIVGLVWTDPYILLILTGPREGANIECSSSPLLL